MFQSTTRSGWGMYGFIFFSLLTLLGFDITQLPTDLADVSLGQLVSVILWSWGTYFRQDTVGGIVRK